MKEKWPFYIVVFSIFLGIVSFNLLSDGMFFDGVYYACFSKVMGLHYESFWSLKHCASCENLFGHPPLAIFLESLLFKFFGDSLYVERIYSLGTYLVSGFVIHKIIKAINPMNQNSWLAILFWVITPLVSWGASNNMLENTMTVFVLLSILFLIKSLSNNQVFNIFFAGIFLFLAFLSKGFVALFPLIFYVVYLFIFKSISYRKAISYSLGFLVSFFLAFILIGLFDSEGWEFLNNYFNEQVLYSIQSDKTVETRFYILERLINEILPALILSIVLLFGYRKTIDFKKWKKDYSWALLFICIGLAGVIPMMISMKQSAFYIISALPFFAIGFSFLVSKQVEKLSLSILNILSIAKFKSISILLLLVSCFLLFNQVGKIGRDKDKIEDVYSVIECVGQNETISISHELYWDWALKAYFYRYGGISLSSKHEDLKDFLLLKKEKNFEFLNLYTLTACTLDNYNLYKLKK